MVQRHLNVVGPRQTYGDIWSPDDPISIKQAPQLEFPYNLLAPFPFSPPLLHQNLVADYGEGCYAWSTDGRKHLDMATGIGVLSTGHCHPRVVAAIQEQAGRMIMAQQNIFPASRPMIALIERFRDIMPEGLSQYVFVSSGSEAVDNAIKIARNATGRPNIITFDGAFHGRTYGAMAATTSKTVYRQTFGPLPAGLLAAPYPYCLHFKARTPATGYELAPSVGEAYARRGCCGGPLEALEWMLKMHTAPQETAAILIEPILGEGGFLTPPPGFLDALRALCDKHGMLLIFDEVQAGVGRTGTWWAHQQLGGAAPDLMTFAKGVASGFPFAGVAARPELFKNMSPGMLGGTYGGNTLGCAAAAATIDVIREEGLLDNVRARGAQLMRGLVDIAARNPSIKDVRGRGLMVAAELGAADGSFPAPYGLAGKVTAAAGRRDMLLLSAGARETIRFLPPLIVGEKEIDDALRIFEESLDEALAAA